MTHKYQIDPLNCLIGERIDKILMHPDQLLLAFHSTNAQQEEKVRYFYAYGDCCSESWIDSIHGIQNILGHIISTTRPVEGTDTDEEEDTEESPEQDFLEEGHCTDVYSYCLSSLHGTCEIIFRNFNNGYYGGWLQPVFPSQNNADGPWEEEDISPEQYIEQLEPLTKDYE